ncbi:caspase family protein [Flammeovirga sp. EKP202]|uniref:caspase family protein n=1 Tax=Flammeovirga sp. EKP202 TaxID=2770592 RepID=UPI00165EC189|nr:caspase family protein [Flammeovirga sp. EKP202]MBD0403883.1 caspase family protein [Flammeovirga sp. EKP202]
MLKPFFLFVLIFFTTTVVFPQSTRNLKRVSNTNLPTDKKIALVIGNSDYVNGGRLKNPVNDARLMAKTLTDLGFEVIYNTNVTLNELQKLEAEFASKIDAYSVSLFYFAGHGVQLDGVNYLLPIDVKLENKNMIKYEGFNIQNINRSFAKNKFSTKIMILDACRNNPFNSFSRGIERGFNRVENQPGGSIIAYATSANSTASDGGNEKNGLYTSVLVDEMKKKQSILHVFMNTRRRVSQMTNGNQIPEDWNKLMNDFFFYEGDLNTKLNEELSFKLSQIRNELDKLEIIRINSKDDIIIIEEKLDRINSDINQLINQNKNKLIGKVDNEIYDSFLKVKNSIQEKKNVFLENNKSEKVKPPNSYLYVTTFKNINSNPPLYTSPSVSSSILHICSKNAKVYVIDDQGKTYDRGEIYSKVCVDGHHGYIAKSYLHENEQ